MFYKVVAALLLAAGPSWAAEVVDVRTSASDEKSRLVFDLSGPVETRYTGGGDKLTIFVSPIDKPNLKTPIVLGWSPSVQHCVNQPWSWALKLSPAVAFAISHSTIPLV